MRATLGASSGSSGNLADARRHALLKLPSHRSEKELTKIRFQFGQHSSTHHLSQVVHQRLAKVISIEHYRAGDIVYRIGETVERVYLLDSGYCEQFRITAEELNHVQAPFPLKPGEEGVRPAPPAMPPAMPHQAMGRRKLLKTIDGHEAQKEKRVSEGKARTKIAFSAKDEDSIKPLLVHSRARSMLMLSGLMVRTCNLRILKQGAATLDSENWENSQLSIDDTGLICADSPHRGHRAAGSLSVEYEEGKVNFLQAQAHDARGMLREVRRVDEFSLPHLDHIARVEFSRGDSLCVCFENEITRREWVQHLTIFRDEEDRTTRALISSKRPDAVFREGDWFGYDEMINPNPIESQSGARTSTVICKTDTVLFVIGRMDYLLLIGKKQVFSLQDRLETLKMASVIPPGDHQSLSRAARALTPMQFSLNSVVCRAGMRVDAVYVVFRGFASICEDSLELQSPRSMSRVNDCGSTYISRIRKVGKLGVGDVFGHIDAMSEDCVYQYTLVADTNKAVIFRLPLTIFLECTRTNDVDDEMKTVEHPGHPPDPAKVPAKVGTAQVHLEKVVNDPKAITPSIGQLLHSHAAMVPKALVSRRVTRSDRQTSPPKILADCEHFSSVVDQEDLFVGPNPNSEIDAATRTEICGDGQDDASGENGDLKMHSIRRQFRLPPKFRKPWISGVKKTNVWKGVCDYEVKSPSIPMLDLTRFMKRAHTDDQDDDEIGFEEFNVAPGCRDIVRSLRKVVQWREPTQRTASQRIKDLVLNSQYLSPLGHQSENIPSEMTTGLVLRVDRLSDKPKKHLEDMLRYIFRDLAIMPGGIMIYPNTQGKLSTAFIKFDNFQDFNSGMSQVLRLGMFAQESTVDELATFHVVHTVAQAVPSSAHPNTPRTSAVYGGMQGMSVRSSGLARTPRLCGSQCTPRPPDLAAVGSSRPWTAPTKADSPVQITGAWKQTPRRPTTQSSARTTPRVHLRHERIGKSFSLYASQDSAPVQH